MSEARETVCCEACGDSGWVLRQCGGSDRLCGRRRPHLAHEFVRPCPCRPINEVYQERLCGAVRLS